MNEIRKTMFDAAGSVMHERSISEYGYQDRGRFLVLNCPTVINQAVFEEILTENGEKL